MSKFPFLVEYHSATRKIYIQFHGQQLPPDAWVNGTLRRKADSYVYLIWETSTDSVRIAEFILTDKFFELQKQPESMADDLSALAAECREPLLRRFDLRWLTCMSDRIAHKNSGDVDQDEHS